MHDQFLPPGQPRRSRLSAMIFVLCMAVVAASALRYQILAKGGDTETPVARPVTPRGALSASELSTIDLFEQCSKSVVYVSPMIERIRRTGFFADRVTETGTGSGFVWDREGHIVTNFHVIQDATACRVTLHDGSTYEASLEGAWPDKDVAVLKIDASKDKLTPIMVGTSNDLQVGQSVYAIGNPFGLDYTLTTGVVSALNREIASVTHRKIQGVIQTDAAINPGNSGGPLLDSAGRLIGINTSIYAPAGVSAGIGFAVPVDAVNDAVAQIIAYGKIVRPGLGINIASDAVSRRLRLPGVLIINVAEGSSAEAAGLKPTSPARDGGIILGDIIVKIDDTATPNEAALLDALANHNVGDTVDVQVQRDDKMRTVKVTLQALE
ncbi:MAG TPA: trypsin-like peptidase domain-containing protein [Phycisphaerae bacterium]|nr:trypsin-like peptidase domain-containing protein [Phycisphaerae bacterium]